LCCKYFHAIPQVASSLLGRPVGAHRSSEAANPVDVCLFGAAAAVSGAQGLYGAIIELGVG
jgi:hypothetical protein